MEPWKEYKLGEVCERLRSGKGISSDQITPTGKYPVWGGNGQRGFSETSNFMGEAAIVGRQGAYCGNVRYFQGEAYMTEHAIVVVGNKMANTKYLACKLQSMNLGKLSAQSAQPGLSVQTLSKLPITLPPRFLQDIIAEFIQTLDRKIELNRRINDNLEQQAQTIFDKMFPNITTGDAMVGDMMIPKRGKGLLSKDAILGSIPVVAGGIEPATYHNVANTKAPVLTIAASGANAGYVNLWHIPIWSSDSSYIDSTMTEHVYFWYVLLKKRQKEIYDAQVGSAQPHIYPKHIAELPIKQIEETTISLFVKRVTPIFGTIGKNMAENQRLASIRDAVLPKLMSGEIKINRLNR